MGTRFKILSMHKIGCTGRRDAEITIGIMGLSENLAGITGLKNPLRDLQRKTNEDLGETTRLL